MTYKWRWDLAKHFDRTHPTFRNPYKKRDRDAARNTLVPGGDDLDRSGVSQRGSGGGGGRKSRSRSRDEDGSRSDDEEDMGVIYNGGGGGGSKMAKNGEVGEASSLFMQSRSPSPVPSDDLNHSHNHHSNLDAFQRVCFYLKLILFKKIYV